MEEIFMFKAKDYTTIMIGRVEYDLDSNEMIFYVQRGDGTKYKYPEHGIEWFKMLTTI